MNLKRKVLLLLVSMALGAACVAQAAEKTVGVVLSGDLPRYKEAYNSFVSALEKGGYGPGKATVYLQTPNPDRMSWVNSVRKFVGVEADVIVTFGGAATTTAIKETNTIPIVYSFVYDPEACGVKKKNTAGVSSKVPMVTLLKTLKSVTPFSKLAVVYNPDEADSVEQYEEAAKNASALGYQVNKVACKTAGEVKGKAAAAAGSCDAVFVTASAVVGKAAPGIISGSMKAGKPSVSQSPDLAGQGALLTLAPSASEQGELAAALVAKILAGAAPGGLAVENARKVDIVLNLKAAKTLGIKVPFDVLNAATKVIK
jgi:putative ABC transport system substrate-binding protein